MKNTLVKHKHYWRQHDFPRSVSFGFLFLLVSIIFNHFASIYATDRASSAVTDLLLDNLPVINVDFIVNEGMGIFAFFIVIVILLEPKRLPFAIKSIALFYFIRSFFIMFTHLGLIPDRSYIDPLDFFQALSVGGDYFFSGHTGFPFLLALIFWRNKAIRDICLLASVFFAVSVIFGHLHYSIDVFAAFFITYSIFSLAREFFKKDYRLFYTEDAVIEAAKAPFADD